MSDRIQLDVDFYFDPPDPSVGYSGTIEIERISFEGVELKSSVDIKELVSLLWKKYEACRGINIFDEIDVIFHDASPNNRKGEVYKFHVNNIL